MTKRRTITTKERVELFKRDGGLCHICGLAIVPGQSWEISHPKPLAMGGADDASNMAPAHKSCHRTLTAVEDLPTIARAVHSEARHLGALPPSKTPIPQRPKSGPKRAARPALPPKQIYVSKDSRT